MRPARAPAAVWARDAESEDPPLVDPAEPVESAKATGIAATAAPTPNATANAPTRPTYRADPDPTPPARLTKAETRTLPIVRT